MRASAAVLRRLAVCWVAAALMAAPTSNACAQRISPSGVHRLSGEGSTFNTTADTLAIGIADTAAPGEHGRRAGAAHGASVGSRAGALTGAGVGAAALVYGSMQPGSQFMNPMIILLAFTYLTGAGALAGALVGAVVGGITGH